MDKEKNKNFLWKGNRNVKWILQKLGMEEESKKNLEHLNLLKIKDEPHPVPVPIEDKNKEKLQIKEEKVSENSTQLKNAISNFR